MKELLQKLLAVLVEKNGTYTTLLGLIKQERELIIRNMTSEMETLIEQQEILLRQTTESEKRRVEIIQAMAIELGIPENQLTMSRIIDGCEEPVKNECILIYDKISTTLKEIEKINKINAELVKSSLDYIDFSLKTYTQAVDTNPTYGDKGGINSAHKKPSSLDHEA